MQIGFPNKAEAPIEFGEVNQNPIVLGRLETIQADVGRICDPTVHGENGLASVMSFKRDARRLALEMAQIGLLTELRPQIRLLMEATMRIMQERGWDTLFKGTYDNIQADLDMLRRS